MASDINNPLNKHKKSEDDFLDLDLSEFIEHRKKTGEIKHEFSSLSGVTTEEDNLTEAEPYGLEAVKTRQIEEQQRLIQVQQLERSARLTEKVKEPSSLENIALAQLEKRHQTELKSLDKKHKQEWKELVEKAKNEMKNLEATSRGLDKEIEKEHYDSIKDLKHDKEQALTLLKRQEKGFEAQQKSDKNKLSHRHIREKTLEFEEIRQLDKTQKKEISDLKATQAKELNGIPKSDKKERARVLEIQKIKMKELTDRHREAQDILRKTHTINDGRRQSETNEFLNQQLGDKQEFQSAQKEKQKAILESYKQKEIDLRARLAKSRLEASNKKAQSTQQLEKTHTKEKDTLAITQTQARNSIERRHQIERENIINQYRQQAQPVQNEQITQQNTLEQQQTQTQLQFQPGSPGNTIQSASASLANQQQASGLANTVQQGPSQRPINLAQRTQTTAAPRAGQPLTVQQRTQINRQRAANQEQQRERDAAQEEALLSRAEDSHTASERLHKTPMMDENSPSSSNSGPSHSQEQENSRSLNK